MQEFLKANEQAAEPIVTVVIPTYGRAKYLRVAIESALKQSFTNFVISIGDNNNNDQSESTVREFNDPRIRYCRHPSNLGSQGNWLELVRRAKTPLVATLHDDDAWQPDFLEKLVPPMVADPALVMAFADYELMDENGGAIPKDTALLSQQTRRDRLPAGRMQPKLADGLRLVAVWQAPNPAICAVVRRDAILQTPFPDACSPLYDLWLNYQFIKRQAPLFFVPGRLTRYRIHANSATAAGFAAPEDHIYETILAENPEAGEVRNEILRYWASIRWGRAVRQMVNIDHSASSRHEFLAAAPHLQRPAKRLVAQLAGRYTLVWSLMRRARQLKYRVTA